jgi:hypothetical protein
MKTGFSLCTLSLQGKTCFHYRFFPVKKAYTGKTLFSLQGWVCSEIKKSTHPACLLGPGSLLDMYRKIFIIFQWISFECYSRFDQSRSLQTLVQMLASFVVVIIINSTLAQYYLSNSKL